MRELKLLLIIALMTPTFARAQKGHYFSRVITVIFENTNYKDAMKSSYFKELANRGANFTNLNAITHPSQGNYVALTSGDLNGVRGDGHYDLNVKNIVDLLEKKNVSWKVYAENFPGNCDTVKKTNGYVRKHNPFISYLNIQKNATRCKNIVNSNEFFKDVQNNSLPEYVFYVPNMDNDGHDTNVAYANKWYQKTFGAYLSDEHFLNDTIVITTFDEAHSYFRRNQIYTSIVGSNINPGSYNDRLNMYSILALIEDNWDLGSLTRNDRDATRVPNIWK